MDSIRPFISGEQIAVRLREMGRRITADYAGQDLLIVGVLKGTFMVMADLARQIKLPAQFDYMAVSSYGAATKTSGVVRVLERPRAGDLRTTRADLRGHSRLGAHS